MIYLQSAGSSGLGTYMLPLMMFAVIYLFFILPQSRKQRAQKKFVTAIQKGDEVVTTSGFIGRVNKIEDGIVHLSFDGKSYVRVLMGSISKEMTDAYNKPAKDKK